MTQGGSLPPTDAAPLVTLAGADTDAVHDPTSRWERRFCVAIFVVAAIVGVVLVAAGQPLPPLGPVVLLGVLVAFSVNLGALFPSEFSATADVAILFAAVVAFVTDAPLLGAFAVGLLMGPLDWVHWRQRLFYRMAYNSGSQSLCVLLAAVLFGTLVSAVDDVVEVLAVAAVSAAVWMIADIALVTLVLVRRGATSTAAAARHVLVLNGVTIPLAVVGAVAGMLARSTGWWAAVLVLAPMPFVPGLVLVRARRIPVRRVLVALRLPALVTTLVGVGIVAGDVDRATLVALAVMSVVVGTEARPDAGTLVAPILATVVIAAAVVVDGRDAYFAAALVAAGGVGAASLTRRLPVRARSRLPVRARSRLPVRARSRRVEWSIGTRALVLGVVAALASAGVYDAIARHGSPSTRVVVAALLAGIAFQVVVITLGGRARGAALGRAACSIPVLAAAAALAVAWVVLGTARGAPVFAAVLFVTMALVAWWGAPPWSSRWLARVGRHARGRRIALGAVAVVAVGAAAVAVVADGRARTTMVMLALVAAEAAVAMAAVAVRQWRFAPRRRIVDAAVLALAGCGLAVVYPVLGLAGRGWSAPVLAALLVPVIAVAWPLGALADRAANPGPRDGGDQRMPERRNASA